MPFSITAAGAVTAAFLFADLAFFGATLFKIPDGGWFPLALGAIVFFIMVTWRRGREARVVREGSILRSIRRA